jgi:hypothetical protein
MDAAASAETAEREREIETMLMTTSKSYTEVYFSESHH